MRPRPKKNRLSRMENVSEYQAVALEDINCSTPEKMRKTGEGMKIDVISSYSKEFAEKPLYMEIGCGKGTFICEMSGRYPDVRFLALELAPDVMMMAMEKCKNARRNNVCFYRCDASIVSSLVPEHSVDRLYLNFSDPWPKARYAKRRLTHRGFLESYKKILKPNGSIFFKTDNRPLFDFSLEEFCESGYRLENVTFDLHNSPLGENNIKTEYEVNFSAKGFTINYLEAYLD